MKKRGISMLMILAVLLSVCIPAAGADNQKLQVRDLADYARGKLTFEALVETPESTIRRFRGKPDAENAVLQYMQTLLKDNQNLTMLEGVGFDGTGKGGFFSVTYVYNGKLNIENSLQNPFDGQFRCGVICVTYTIDSEEIRGGVQIAPGAEFWNQSKAEGSNAANAGKDSGTSSQISDLGLNQAVVVRGNDTLTTSEVSFTYNKKTGVDEFRIYNYTPGEGIVFSVPHDYLMTGYRLGRKELGIDTNMERYWSGLDQFFGTTYQFMVGICRNKEYMYVHDKVINSFENAELYVREWNRTEGYALIDLKLTFSDAPKQIAVQAKFNLEDVGYVGKAEQVSVSVGKTVNLSFPYTEFHPVYSLFNWEVLSGGSCVELTNAVSKTCTVKALQPGRAVIRCTYEYGKEQPNVLTGFPETWNRTKTLSFVIDIQ